MRKIKYAREEKANGVNVLTTGQPRRKHDVVTSIFQLSVGLKMYKKGKKKENVQKREESK